MLLSFDMLCGLCFAKNTCQQAKLLLLLLSILLRISLDELMLKTLDFF